MLRPPSVLSHQYARAKRVNTHVLAYERYLMQATSTAVWYVPEGGAPTLDAGSGPSGALAPADGAPLVTAIANTPGFGPPLPFLIGQFVLDDGRQMVMLHNQHVMFDAIPVITFAAGTRFLCQVSPSTGRERPLLGGAAIEAGSAVLVVASPTACEEPLA